MDKGKRPIKLSSNDAIYLDLKDIMREHALAFLPAKALFRFLAVCREWRLKISSPFFAHGQTISFRAISGLFCQSPGKPPSFLPLDQLAYGVPDPSLSFLPELVDIRSSSSGLLCCQGRTGERMYYICNPVTKNLKKLPKPNADHGSDPDIVLIYEPSLYGFVADYKLVCAFPSNDLEGAFEFEIYSSADDSWTISGELFFGDSKFQTGSGVHANGVVYWRVSSDVLAFDIAKERAQLIADYSMRGCLGVMFKKPCMTQITGTTISVSVLSNLYSNTMEMNTRSKTWKNIISQSVDGEAGGVVLFSVDNMVVIQSGATIFSYDLKAKKKVILSTSSGHAKTYLPYVNSLVYL